MRRRKLNSIFHSKAATLSPIALGTTFFSSKEVSNFFFFEMQRISSRLGFGNIFFGWGRGGGASGRATAFCLSGPGSNPGGALGSNLGFFWFRCRQSILAGRRAFFLSIKWDLSIKVTSLFFPLSYHQTMSVQYCVINCNSNVKNKPEKRPGMAHIKKNTMARFLCQVNQSCWLGLNGKKIPC